MKRNFIYLAVCMLSCAAACQNHQEEKEEQTTFTATSPVQMDTSITKDYVCQIHSIHHIELRAQERGYLEKIFVDEGQFVRKGQLLFKIMPKLYEAEMYKAKAEAQTAEIEYANTKSLADRDVVAPNELAMAKAKLDKAKAELALTQVHLGFTEIRAPFDGIIDRFHVRPGSLVDEGELLSELSDNQKMWVYYNVPEAEYLDYKMTSKADSAMQVKLLMANNQLFPYDGKVETIEANFNSETGNIAFRATFPNPDGLLRHGETGNIRMSETFDQVLLIPQKATMEVLDKKYVYLIGPDKQVRMTPVTIGAELPDLYVITEGLKPGDKILLEGLRKVSDHQQIAYEFEDPKEVMAHLSLPTE